MIAFLAATAFTCTQPVVVDGDSLKCGTRKVRLAGIDAPELHGCRGRPGRHCVAGNGFASRRAMLALVAGQPLRCAAIGSSYDRVVARCRLPNGRDLSCAAIGAKVAVRWSRYDPQGLLLGC